MFYSRYASLVEHERLALEYLDLRQETESVTEITKIFTKRAMFCLDFAASEQAQMTRYLSMLKMDIRQFISTKHYGSLLELEETARRREIKMKLQSR